MPCDKRKAHKKIAINQQGQILKCYFWQSRKTLNHHQVTKSKYVKKRTLWVRMVHDPAHILTDILAAMLMILWYGNHKL